MIEGVFFFRIKLKGVGFLNFLLFLIKWVVLLVMRLVLMKRMISSKVSGGKVYWRYLWFFCRLIVFLKGIGLIFFDFWFIFVMMSLWLLFVFVCEWSCSILSSLFCMLLKCWLMIWVACLCEIICLSWK